MTERKSWLIEDRKKRIKMAKQILRNLNKIEFKKATAILSENLGVRPDKANEYIKQFVDFGCLKSYKENGLWFVEYVHTSEQPDEIK